MDATEQLSRLTEALQEILASDPEIKDVVFPGTDSKLVLESRSRRTGPGLFDWGIPVLTGGRMRLGVDTFLIVFTNAP